MKKIYQIRIEGDDGILIECHNYTTKRTAHKNYGNVTRKFRNNELDVYHIELVEVLFQESV